MSWQRFIVMLKPHTARHAALAIAECPECHALVPEDSIPDHERSHGKRPTEAVWTVIPDA